MSASLSLFDKEHAAQEKYIYFICSVAGALVAYIGKDYTPKQPWTLQDKFTISALGCLLIAFLLGIGRILAYIKGISINKDVLVTQEEIANHVDALIHELENKNESFLVHINKKSGKPYSRDEIEKRIPELNSSSEKDSARMKKWFNFSTFLFVVCHLFLILGFVLMVWAKFAGRS